MLLISFFIVQCYASMVFAMALRLSVFVAVASRSSTKMAKYIELVFGMEIFFHLSYILL